MYGLNTFVKTKKEMPIVGSTKGFLPAGTRCMITGIVGSYVYKVTVCDSFCKGKELLVSETDLVTA